MTVVPVIPVVAVGRLRRGWGAVPAVGWRSVGRLGLFLRFGIIVWNWGVLQNVLEHLQGWGKVPYSRN